MLHPAHSNRGPFPLSTFHHSISSPCTFEYTQSISLTFIQASYYSANNLVEWSGMYDTSAVKNLVEANLYKPNAIEPPPNSNMVWNMFFPKFNALPIHNFVTHSALLWRYLPCIVANYLFRIIGPNWTLHQIYVSKHNCSTAALYHTVLYYTHKTIWNLDIEAAN